MTGSSLWSRVAINEGTLDDLLKEKKHYTQKDWNDALISRVNLCKRLLDHVISQSRT